MTLYHPKPHRTTKGHEMFVIIDKPPAYRPHCLSTPARRKPGRHHIDLDCVRAVIHATTAQGAFKWTASTKNTATA